MYMTFFMVFIDNTFYIKSKIQNKLNIKKFSSFRQDETASLHSSDEVANLYFFVQ